MMRGATIFLRIVIVLVAIAAVAVCAFPLRLMLAEEAAKGPGTGWQIYVFLVGAYLQSAIFLFALYQGFRLLGYFGGNAPFSEQSVSALRNIKLAAVAIGLLMGVGLGWLMFLTAGTGEDSAGPAMIGFIGTFVSGVAAAAAMVAQTLVQKAVDTPKNDFHLQQK